MKHLPALLLTTAALQAQTGLLVRVRPAHPSLSDTIELEVSLHNLRDSEAALLPADIAPDYVEIVSVRDEGSRRILTLDPLKPGPCRIPAFRTRCLGTAVKGCEIQSAETIIPVTTKVTTNDIRDKDEEPLELKRSSNGQSLWWWLTPLCLLPVAISAWYFRRRSKRNAERRAERRLKTLANSTEAYDVLRDYLNDRLNLGARSCSSPELITALRERGICQGWAAKELSRFLAASDHERFSGVSGFAGNASRMCRELIQIIDFDTTRRSRVRL